MAPRGHKSVTLGPRASNCQGSSPGIRAGQLQTPALGSCPGLRRPRCAPARAYAVLSAVSVTRASLRSCTGEGGLCGRVGDTGLAALLHGRTRSCRAVSVHGPPCAPALATEVLPAPSALPPRKSSPKKLTTSAGEASESPPEAASCGAAGFHGACIAAELSHECVAAPFLKAVLKVMTFGVGL